MIEVKKIDVLSFSLLVGIFEFWNLLFLSLINLKNSFILGFVVGFLGALFAIINFNLIPVKIKLHHKKILNLNKINYIIPSLANGFFLGVLFYSQGFLRFLPDNSVGLALLGFFSVLITLFICSILYNFLFSKIRLKIGGSFSEKSFFIEKVNIISFPLYAGLFEFLIMPMMGLFFSIFSFFPRFISFPISGLLAGFFGSLLASFCYNFFAKYLKGIGFDIE